MAIASPPRVDVERFQEEGYLVVEDVLDVERDLDPVIREYEQRLDEILEPWHAAGKIPSTYPGQSIAHRVAAFLSDGGGGAYQALDISLPLRGATEETPMHLGPAVFN